MDRVFEFNSNIFLDDRRFERARHCEIFWNSTPSTQICLFGPANLASGRCRALAAAREFNSSTQGRYKQARFGRLVEVIDEHEIDDDVDSNSNMKIIHQHLLR